MSDLFFQFLARGHQQVVGATRAVRTELSETHRAASQVDASTRRAESTFQRMGTTMTRTVTPAATAAGAAFYKASQDYGEGLTALRAGAGATGESLAALEASASRLAGQVAADFGAVSTVMADLATRTGATGQALEDLTRQTLQLQELGMGGDVATLTRVFGDWGVALEDSTAAIDGLYRASQTTGPTVDRLGQLMVQFGAPLREFGFQMDEAAALLGKFEQEGVNTELVMGALRIALGKFAAAGRDPVQALEDIIGEIQGAGTAAEANTLAFEVFGRRAGVDMSRAIQEGRFDLEALTDSLAANRDTVDEAYQSTRTFIDRLDMLKDRGMAVIGPVGDVGFAISGVAMAAGPAIQGLGRLRTSFANTSRAGMAMKAGGLAAATIGLGLLVDRLMAARSAADSFAGGFLTELGTEDPRAQLIALREEAERLSDVATAGWDVDLGLVRLIGSAEARDAFNQLDALTRQIENLEAQLHGAEAAANATRDAHWHLAEVMPKIGEGIGPAIGAVVTAHDGWTTTLDRLRGAERTTRSEIELTTAAMQARLDQARAAVDPVFAATSAQRNLGDAQRRLTELQSAGNTSQEDLQAAQEAAATAALDLESALVGLHAAQEDGTTASADFESTLQRQVDQGRITQETYDALILRLEDIEAGARRASLAMAGMLGGPLQLPSDAREALAGAGVSTPAFDAAPRLAGLPAASATPVPAFERTSVQFNGPVTIGGRTVSADDPDIRALAQLVADEVDHRRARR